MNFPRRLPAWLALVLAALGLTALYLGPIRTHLLNDDYLFLEEARTRPLVEALAHPGALPNYYRPLSRQIYFAAMASLAGGHPLAFHVFNFVLFLAALALLFDLLLALLPFAGAMIGCLYFALLPFQRVNLTWVSCSQDLLALAFGLATLALARRGRRALAMLAFVAAIASKESALPIPASIAAWTLLIERRGWKAALLRAAPFLVVALLWVGLARSLTIARGAPAFLHFTPSQFAAAYAHLVQSLLGLETWAGLGAALVTHTPQVAALLLLLPIALLYEWKARHPDARAPVEPRRVTLYAIAWLVAFGVVLGPVAHTWSAYYTTLAAAGGAMIVGLVLARGDRWTWALATSFLLWWHAGSTAVPMFALADRPWGWTSHITTFYFERAAALTDTLARQLVALAPHPPRGSRFFFATLPPWAGFQMGNGALIRDRYRDPTLGSYFYTQFSETTAAFQPTRFFYWDGAALRDLYPNTRDPMFQVGSDLLLLDRPAGAAHALRRALDQGGDRMDDLYWLGWAYLWKGDRALAERTWTRFGAIDDSLLARAHLRAAHNALVDGDTLEARRNLIRSIEFGMGRPEAHAVLGELLMAERPKYGALELKVATWLLPEDWMARRSLALTLASVRLDDGARREFEALARVHPQWRSDSVVVQAWRALERRNGTGTTVARF